MSEELRQAVWDALSYEWKGSGDLGLGKGNRLVPHLQAFRQLGLVESKLKTYRLVWRKTNSAKP